MARALRLRQVRAVMGGNQAAVARRLGIHQSRWNRFERGALDIHLDVLEDFCRLYGVSADWIVLGDLLALNKPLVARMAAAYPELAALASPPGDPPPDGGTPPPQPRR